MFCKMWIMGYTEGNENARASELQSDELKCLFILPIKEWFALTPEWDVNRQVWLIIFLLI